MSSTCANLAQPRYRGSQVCVCVCVWMRVLRTLGDFAGRFNMAASVIMLASAQARSEYFGISSCALLRQATLRRLLHSGHSMEDVMYLVAAEAAEHNVSTMLPLPPTTSDEPDAAPVQQDVAYAMAARRIAASGAALPAPPAECDTQLGTGGGQIYMLNFTMIHLINDRLHVDLTKSKAPTRLVDVQPLPSSTAMVGSALQAGTVPSPHALAARVAGRLFYTVPELAFFPDSLSPEPVALGMKLRGEVADGVRERYAAAHGGQVGPRTMAEQRHAESLGASRAFVPSAASTARGWMRSLTSVCVWCVCGVCVVLADEFVLARGMVRRLRLRNNFPVPIQLHMASVSDPRMLLLQVPEGAVAQPYGVWPALSVVVPFAADATMARIRADLFNATCPGCLDAHPAPNVDDQDTAEATVEASGSSLAEQGDAVAAPNATHGHHDRAALFRALFHAYAPPSGGDESASAMQARHARALVYAVRRVLEAVAQTTEAVVAEAEAELAIVAESGSLVLTDGDGAAADGKKASKTRGKRKKKTKGKKVKGKKKAKSRGRKGEARGSALHRGLRSLRRRMEVAGLSVNATFARSLAEVLSVVHADTAQRLAHDATGADVVDAVAAAVAASDAARDGAASSFALRASTMAVSVAAAAMINSFSLPFNATLSLHTNMSTFTVPLRVCSGQFDIAAGVLDRVYQAVTAVSQSALHDIAADGDARVQTLEAVLAAAAASDSPPASHGGKDGGVGRDSGGGTGGGASGASGDAHDDVHDAPPPPPPPGSLLVKRHATPVGHSLAPQDHPQLLDFGTMAAGTTRTLDLRVSNPNALPLVLESASIYEPLAPFLSIDLVVVTNAAAVDDDWGGRAADSNSMAHGAAAGTAAGVPSPGSDGGGEGGSGVAAAWVVQPGGQLQMTLTLAAPESPQSIDAPQAVLLRGMVHMLPVRVRAQVVEGTTLADPNEVRMEPTFPGRDVVDGVYITNTHPVPLHVTRARVVNSSAPGLFAVALTHAPVEPSQSAMAAVVTFRPAFSRCGHVGVSAACLDAGRHRKDQDHDDLSSGGGGGAGDAASAASVSGGSSDYTDYYDEDGGSSGARIRLVAAAQKEEAAWQRLIASGQDTASAVVELETNLGSLLEVPVTVQLYRPSLVRFVAQAPQSRKRRSVWAQATVSRALAADVAAGIVAVEQTAWTADVLASPKGVTSLTFPLAEFGGVASEVYVPVLNPSDAPLRVTLVPPCEAVLAGTAVEDALASAQAVLANVRHAKSHTRHARLVRYLNTTSRQILAAWRGAAAAVREARVLPLPVGYQQQEWLGRLGEACCCMDDAANSIQSWEDEVGLATAHDSSLQRAVGVVPAAEWSDDTVCNAVGPGTGDGDGRRPIGNPHQPSTCTTRPPSFAYGAREGAVLSALIPAGSYALLGPITFRPLSVGKHQAVVWLANNLTVAEPFMLLGEAAMAHVVFVPSDTLAEDADEAAAAFTALRFEPTDQRQLGAVPGRIGYRDSVYHASEAFMSLFCERRRAAGSGDADVDAVNAAEGRAPPGVGSDNLVWLPRSWMSAALCWLTDSVRGDPEADGALRAKAGRPVNEHAATFQKVKLVNVGPFPTEIVALDIDGAGCAGYGFHVANCGGVPYVVALCVPVPVPVPVCVCCVCVVCVCVVCACCVGLCVV